MPVILTPWTPFDGKIWNVDDFERCVPDRQQYHDIMRRAEVEEIRRKFDSLKDCVRAGWWFAGMKF